MSIQTITHGKLTWANIERPTAADIDYLNEHYDFHPLDYEDVLSKTSTDWAPWYIVPANRKWYRNLVVGSAVIEALKALDMRHPEPTFDPADIRID